MEVIKVLASETTCNSTAQTYNGNKLIRLFNNTASPVLITRLAANTSVTIGTFTLAANAQCACAKDATDNLTANASILAVPVAFAN
jgi:hypothetical protein